ncbi:hypothetical protein BP6252_05187 [Coleophoma cylindrospora]|uniref:HhH-GPD domain-containing protein n=1 Tax=Coleophoma cylindrospora TaxID=1849047 RepID=A0A3D8RTF1_9HELO|nr:hypothetical protein BP6252_05187 [Coleophoma cylindrospora]
MQNTPHVLPGAEGPISSQQLRPLAIPQAGTMEIDSEAKGLVTKFAKIHLLKLRRQNGPDRRKMYAMDVYQYARTVGPQFGVIWAKEKVIHNEAVFRKYLWSNAQALPRDTVYTGFHNVNAKENADLIATLSMEDAGFWKEIERLQAKNRGSQLTSSQKRKRSNSDASSQPANSEIGEEQRKRQRKRVRKNKDGTLRQPKTITPTDAASLEQPIASIVSNGTDTNTPSTASSSTEATGNIDPEAEAKKLRKEAKKLRLQQQKQADTETSLAKESVENVAVQDPVLATKNMDNERPGSAATSSTTTSNKVGEKPSRKKRRNQKKQKSTATESAYFASTDGPKSKMVEQKSEDENKEAETDKKSAGSTKARKRNKNKNILTEPPTLHDASKYYSDTEKPLVKTATDVQTQIASTGKNDNETAAKANSSKKEPVPKEKKANLSPMERVAAAMEAEKEAKRVSETVAEESASRITELVPKTTPVEQNNVKSEDLNSIEDKPQKSKRRSRGRRSIGQTQVEDSQPEAPPLGDTAEDMVIDTLREADKLSTEALGSIDNTPIAMDVTKESKNSVEEPAQAVDSTGQGDPMELDNAKPVLVEVEVVAREKLTVEEPVAAAPVVVEQAQLEPAPATEVPETTTEQAKPEDDGLPTKSSRRKTKPLTELPNTNQPRRSTRSRKRKSSDKVTESASGSQPLDVIEQEDFKTVGPEYDLSSELSDPPSTPSSIPQGLLDTPSTAKSPEDVTADLETQQDDDASQSASNYGVSKLSFVPKSSQEFVDMPKPKRRKSSPFKNEPAGFNVKLEHACEAGEVTDGDLGEASFFEDRMLRSACKAKRAPAKSPYFTPTASVSKTQKSKMAADTEPATPQRAGSVSPSKKSPKKRSPGGIISCIPFPPLSAEHFGLIQEKLASDPFRLLVAVTFLIRTHGKHAIPVFYELMDQYPTPESLVEADKADILPIIRHLGLQNQRATTYQTYAKIWLENPPMKGKRYGVRDYPSKGDGRDVKKDEILDDGDERLGWEIGHMTQGPYAIDSWRIFCRDICRGLALGWNGEGVEDKSFQPEWMRVLPLDKELRAYLRWMWLKEGFEWDPFTGEKEIASEELQKAAMAGRIAWDDMGGMRILDEGDAGIMFGDTNAVEDQVGVEGPEEVTTFTADKVEMEMHPAKTDLS